MKADANRSIAFPTTSATYARPPDYSTRDERARLHLPRRHYGSLVDRHVIERYMLFISISFSLLVYQTMKGRDAAGFSPPCFGRGFVDFGP